MNELAEGLSSVFLRVLIYPGLCTAVLASGLLSVAFLRPTTSSEAKHAPSPWRALSLWAVLALGGSALPAPGAVPPYIAGDALFTLSLVHLGAASCLLPRSWRSGMPAAYTLALGTASLASLSNFLWQDWARLAVGEWYQKVTAELGSLCLVLWEMLLLGEAVVAALGARGPAGALVRMAVGGTAWFSASAAVSVALPALDMPAYLAASLAAASGELALAKVLWKRPDLRRAAEVVGPAMGTLSLAFSAFAAKFLVPSS